MQQKIETPGCLLVWLPPFLKASLPITTELEPEDIDDDAPSRSALRIIDALATSLPPAQVFPAICQLVQQYVLQPDPNARRGALLALGVAVEAVSEFMGPSCRECYLASRGCRSYGS